MKKKIFNILNKVGVPCNLKGRLYIETALEIVLERGMISTTKELYPEIAKKVGTTSTRVERAIRHAIEVCFYNTDPEALFEVFGNAINVKKGKVVNSEFIYGLKKYLEINCKED